MNLKQSKTQRRDHYFKVLWPLTMALIVYYAYMYNNKYEALQFNGLFLSISLAHLLLPAVGKWLLKNSFVGACCLVLTSCLALGLMLFIAGGIMSPGVYWVVGLPVMGHVLGGHKLSYLGVFFVIVMIAVFLIFEQQSMDISVVKNFDIYTLERKRNIILFFLFSFFLVLYYGKIEENQQKLILNQSNQVETLLRILIHDIGSPLMVLKYRMDAAKKFFSLEGDEMYQKIQASLSCIDELVQHVSSMRSLKDGKFSFECHQVEMVSVIKKSVNEISESALRKGVEVVVKTPKTPVLVWANETALRIQIINNLLSNALKFSLEGGKIYIDLSVNHGEVNLSIRDEGIGMPESIRKDLFNIEAKTSRRGTQNEPGTGYGMPIAYEFVKKFNGQLWIESTEKIHEGIQHHGTHHGTTYFLKFPIIS